MIINLDKISPLNHEVILFFEELANNPKVEELIVFGSRACGDYDTYSDVDLAVVAPTFTKAEWVMLYAQAIHDIRTVLKISIVNYVSNPERLKKRIRQNGVVIYES